MSQSPKIAYVKLEGVLYSQTVFHHAAYLAANHQGMSQRVLRLGQAMLSRQVARFLDTNDRVSAIRLAFQSLRHMSEDRLRELADEYVSARQSSNLLKGGKQLFKRIQNNVDLVVIVSESIDCIAEPYRDALGHDIPLLCNSLDSKNHFLTGALSNPVIGGQDLTTLINRDCAERGGTLANTVGYGCIASDVLFLNTVGEPCAVNPDFTLRRIASNARWPIIDY